MARCKSGLIVISILVFVLFHISLCSAIEITGYASKMITGDAAYQTMNVSVCIEEKLQINNTCPNEILYNESLDCMISGINFNLTNISFFVANKTFSVNDSGRIHIGGFNQSDIGDHLLFISFQYITNCGLKYITLGGNFSIKQKNTTPPVCSKNMPNITIYQDEILLLLMGLYCTDEDGDPLTFSYETDRPEVGFKFTVINDTLLFITESWFYGETGVFFRATDPANQSDSTNLFKILVRQRPPPKADDNDELNSKSKSSSGYMGIGTIITCFPNWECGQWSECLSSGYKIRECNDTRNCNISLFKPNTTEYCNYTPTCFDGVKNGDEEGIDCGGVCPNKCDASANTCSNGIKDGDEEGIDCGGVCPNKCVFTEFPIGEFLMGEKSRLIFYILLLILLLILICELAYQAYKHRKSIRKTIRGIKTGKGLSGEELKKKDLMLRLDNLLGMLHNDKTPIETPSAELAKIMSDFIRILTKKDVANYQELIEIMSGYNLDKNLKEIILNLQKEIMEIEFSKEKMTRTQMISIAYDLKNAVATTMSLKTYDYKMPDALNVPPKDREGELFQMLSNANYNLIKENYTEMENIRKNIKNIILSENIKNKPLIYSYNRLVKMIGQSSYGKK